MPATRTLYLRTESEVTLIRDHPEYAAWLEARGYDMNSVHVAELLPDDLEVPFDLRDASLVALELEVLQGLRGFVVAGNALRAIHDGGLHTVRGQAWCVYVEETWGMSQSQAYRLMDAAQVMEVLSPFGDTAPTCEAQCRALVPILRDDDSEDGTLVREVWQAAIDHAAATAIGGRPTARHVTEALMLRYAQAREDETPTRGWGDVIADATDGWWDRLERKLETLDGRYYLIHVEVGVADATVAPVWRANTSIQVPPESEGGGGA